MTATEEQIAMLTNCANNARERADKAKPDSWPRQMWAEISLEFINEAIELEKEIE